MKAYAQEIQDGLQELIENNTTIAYCAPVISETNTLSTAAGKYEEDRALALNFLGLEDTQAENKEQIEVSKFYESLPKPHALAIEEWFKNKVYHRNTDEDV